VNQRSLWQQNRYLLLRRCSQLIVLSLFLSGPLWGIWLLTGNLAASLLLDTLPFTDPLVFAQTLAAGVWPEKTLALGAVILITGYALLGRRVFCSWVCPVNPVTDAARWLRAKLGIKGGIAISRQARYYLLAMILVGAFISGSLLWELVNPVTLVARSLIFALGSGFYLLGAIFLFDLLLARDGWCGHLCPTGAMYRLIGQKGLLAVKTPARQNCDDCMDCYQVCPEPHILRPALKGQTQSSLIVDADCTLCGRCVDVCDKQVFEIGVRTKAPEYLQQVEKKV